MITNKTRLLAGVALGCVLSTPAAFAEEYRGFYFGLSGGAGKADWPSKRSFDTSFSAAWVRSQLSNSVNAVTLRPSSLDDSPDVWGAQIGYRANKYFAAEFGYVHLGEVQYDVTGTATLPNTSADIATGYRFATAGPTAAAVGLLPLGKYFELHAKGGVFLADSRQTVRIQEVTSRENVYHERIDASQTELFAGIGATWNATESLAVRVEYQRFFNVGDDEKTVEENIDVISLGVLFK